jgi:AraC-like DNA-binding protein
MYYAELPARPDLKPWIAAHWHFRVDPGAGALDHWVPLTGGAFLGVARGRGALVVGPRVAPFHTVVHGGDVHWGTHLWPGAGGALFGPALAGLREAIAPAAQVLDPAWVGRLTARLETVDDEAEAAAVLDAAWAERLPGAAPLDDAVMTAVFGLLESGGEEPIALLARRAGLSPRQLRRRFRAAVGLAPKQLARLQRFRTSAVERVRQGAESWVGLAAAHGYADQAHLVREYRSLVGLSPTAFERHLRRIEHGRLLR